MIQLTEEQRRQLEQPGPACVLDPETGQTYVLLRADVYERLSALLEDEVRAMQPLLAELAPEDWEDAAVYEPKP